MATTASSHDVAAINLLMNSLVFVCKWSISRRMRWILLYPQKFNYKIFRHIVEEIVMEFIQ